MEILLVLSVRPDHHGPPSTSRSARSISSSSAELDTRPRRRDRRAPAVRVSAVAADWPTSVGPTVAAPPRGVATTHAPSRRRLGLHLRVSRCAPALRLPDASPVTSALPARVRAADPALVVTPQRAQPTGLRPVETWWPISVSPAPAGPWRRCRPPRYWGARRRRWSSVCSPRRNRPWTRPVAGRVPSRACRPVS